MKVIDVSKHNGNIDWKKVRADGVEGVIIRAGYGKMINQKDICFEKNYSGAKAAGLSVGTYFYTYAKNTADAKKESEVFLEWVKDKSFELPVYFDIEDVSMEHLSREVLTDICVEWCGRVERAGYYTGIYANVYWFKNKLDLDRLSCYDKWLAHWAEKPAFDESFGGMWQYSSKGRVNGINGDTDLNECYRDYPSVIKRAKLNGFADSRTYTVNATVHVSLKSEAEKIAQQCSNLGMTAVISERR